MNPRDWTQLRTAYIEGFVVDGRRLMPTLEELAETFKVPASSIRKRSMSEHWPELRNNFRTAVEQQRREQATQALAAAGAQIDVSAAKVAIRLLEHVARHLDQIEAKKEIVAPGIAVTLAKAVAICQQVDQLAGGRPTAIQEQHVLDANAEVRKWRQVTERLTTAELEDAIRGIAPVRRVQAEIERESNQGDKPLH